MGFIFVDNLRYPLCYPQIFPLDITIDLYFLSPFINTCFRIIDYKPFEVVIHISTVQLELLLMKEHKIVNILYCRRCGIPGPDLHTIHDISYTPTSLFSIDMKNHVKL